MSSMGKTGLKVMRNWTDRCMRIQNKFWNRQDICVTRFPIMPDRAMRAGIILPIGPEFPTMDAAWEPLLW